jgi:uncharacterized protein
MSRAIVTGASGGLGLEFAKLLAADKHDLALIARSRDKLESLAAELRAQHGVKVETVALDLGALDAATSVFARVPACDILINNAGFANNGRFDELAPGSIREEIMLDVLTLTELTRAYLPGMLARGAGRVMNVASTAGFLPGPYMAVYYAAKAFVISFSQAIAEELRGSGVTVTAFCPGATATGFAQRANVAKTRLFSLGVSGAAPVAKAGYRAMLAGRELYVPGASNKIAAFLPRISPRRMLVSVSGKLVRPPRGPGGA